MESNLVDVWIPIINSEGYISNSTSARCGPDCRFIITDTNGIEECLLTSFVGKQIHEITGQLNLSPKRPNTLPQNNQCPVQIRIRHTEIKFTPFANLPRRAPREV